MGQAKPYDIPKRWVWEAYKRVKENRGAAGVDEQSIEVFEADLQSNLYKLWNRMSSGSYFPPPVKRVQIDKRDGGKRPLGIPTVSDRVAQAVVKGYLEPDLEKTLSSRLVRISTRKIGARCRWGCSPAMLAASLRARSRHSGLF
ncbi:retron-type reverse transcriptase [Bradyrhizobium elkanii]